MRRRKQSQEVQPKEDDILAQVKEKLKDYKSSGVKASFIGADTSTPLEESKSRRKNHTEKVPS